MSDLAWTLRPATAGDAAVIAEHRVSMFRDMGQVPTDELARQLLRASIAALEPLLIEGTYVGWLALDGGGRVIAGAGAHVKTQLPRIAQDRSSVDLTALPVIVNVYTLPAWRGRGIARALMQAAMAWGVSRSFDRLVLHASEAGRPLYASLGFVATNEMVWLPRGPAPGA